MKNSSEVKELIKINRSLKVAMWAFRAQKHSKGDLMDIIELDAPVYAEDGLNNISRFPTNTEPLRRNYLSKVSEKVWDEQGVFWAAHFRYTMQGQFYDIARFGIQLLQQNKFRSNQQFGVKR